MGKIACRESRTGEPVYYGAVSRAESKFRLSSLLHLTEHPLKKARLKVSNVKGRMCRRIVPRLLLVAIVLGSTISVGAPAQAVQSAPASDMTSLLWTGEQVQPTGAPASDQVISSSIAGTVVDPNGTVVPGATVKLTGPNAAMDQTVLADTSGRFIFSNLSAGTFRITVTAPNLTTLTSDQIVLTAGQNLQLPQIALRLGSTHADVNVVATLEEVAQAQVQAQEKQRVFGVFPNFYSSYIWDAAPMTPKQKFGLALRSSTDPMSFAIPAAIAGVEQWHNTFPGYGRGAQGYFKRYGATYADGFIGRMIGSSILPSLFKQDPRYFYRGSGTTKTRAWYAISQTFVCRSDDGRTEINWSHLLGSFAAAGVSNIYRAPEDRSASLTIRNGFIIVGSSAVTNLIREFLLRKITSKVPDYAQGKP